jgi:hypothetical protein
MSAISAAEALERHSIGIVLLTEAAAHPKPIVLAPIVAEAETLVKDLKYLVPVTVVAFGPVKLSVRALLSTSVPDNVNVIAERFAALTILTLCPRLSVVVVLDGTHGPAPVKLVALKPFAEIVTGTIEILIGRISYS